MSGSGQPPHSDGISGTALPPPTVDGWLGRWQARLGLEDFRIELERISTWAVCDEHCRVGNSLVGVVADHARREATIYHTRRLTSEDLVHELLHVRHPDWSEAAVIAETERLLEGSATLPVARAA